MPLYSRNKKIGRPNLLKAKWPHRNEELKGKAGPMRKKQAAMGGGGCRPKLLPTLRCRVKATGFSRGSRSALNA